jgi:hypothetical protein
VLKTDLDISVTITYKGLNCVSNSYFLVTG